MNFTAPNPEQHFSSCNSHFSSFVSSHVMYIGTWKTDVKYTRGDIVSRPVDVSASEYYACVIGHTSCTLTVPCKEDVYWIHLDNQFLRNMAHVGQDAKRKEFVVPSAEHIEMHAKTRKRLRTAERDLQTFKRRRGNDTVSELRDRLLLLNVDVETKSFLIDKYDSSQKLTGSDQTKAVTWLNTVAKIPFGRCKHWNVKANDSPVTLRTFFDNVRSKLDKHIYGLQSVKQEIIEFVARKVSNPQGKGHVLALWGAAGVGKTKIIKSLAEALELPFYQINFGGLNDSSVLTGHSETYVSSKPGKLVEILTNSTYMNPIIYLDEVDKISCSKSREINGILTHLLDEEQNDKFQDNYLSNVNINMSKAFFVISFNDITKVDSIVCDRMKVIYVNPPSLDEKIKICRDKMIPEILSSIRFDKRFAFSLSDDLLSYIITHKVPKEDGVRQLQDTLEDLFNKVNYHVLIGEYKKVLQVVDHDDGESCPTKQEIILTRAYIDDALSKRNTAGTSERVLSMYT